jgi:phenylacetate-CoA ligase
MPFNTWTISNDCRLPRPPTCASFIPFPLRSVPFEQIVRIHASSGTTGKRKIIGYTQKDLDDWVHFFARCYEMAGVTPLDRVQIAVGYGIWTAGMGFQLGCEKVGAMAVPVGPGNLDMHLQFMQDIRSTVFLQYGVHGPAHGRRDPSARHRRQNQHSQNHLRIRADLTLHAPPRSVSCSAAPSCSTSPVSPSSTDPAPASSVRTMTASTTGADYYILEIVDPETLEPVPDGEWGEMVVTTLSKEAAPLIRYRTRDITRIIPGSCTCGSVMPKHSRIKGRSDDTIKFRGVNIYPSTIDTILSAIPGLGSEYQIHLTREEKSGKDFMKLVIERGQAVDAGRSAELTHEIIYQIKKQLLVSAQASWWPMANCPEPNVKASGYSIPGLPMRSYKRKTGPRRASGVAFR